MAYIDVTDFVFSNHAGVIFGSVMTHGPDAGRVTWGAAKSLAADETSSGYLGGEGELEAFRDHVRGFGAWDDDEIAAWDRNECVALFLQMVAAELGEMPRDDDGGIDWSAAEAEAGEGTISGRLMVGDGGRALYYLGD